MSTLIEEPNKQSAISTSLAPWISVQSGVNAVSFYKSAFGATEVYRLEDPEGGLVVKLSIDAAEFWVSGGTGNDNSSTLQHENSIRMILTVADPDAFFARALQAGATEIFPVGEEYGWKVLLPAHPPDLRGDKLRLLQMRTYKN